MSAICRICGERRDESHVPSPYLCAFNPNRDAVGEAIRQQTPASEIARKSIREVPPINAAGRRG